MHHNLYIHLLDSDHDRVKMQFTKILTKTYNAKGTLSVNFDKVYMRTTGQSKFLNL